jgi:hypothetical protein
MSIDYTEWHRKQAAIAERMNREHLKRADREAYEKINDMYLAARDFGASHDLAFDIAKRSVGDAADEPVSKASRVGHEHLASRLVEHLIDRLDDARRRRGFEKQESTMESMSHAEFVRDVVKRYGIVSLAKSMVQDEKSYGLDEFEFTRLATEHAQRAYPNMNADAAFAKVFSDNGADGVMLRKAHALTKSPFDLEPVYVGGPDATHDAVNSTESSEAYAQLQDMAEKLRASSPWLSGAQAFERVFTAKENAALAQKAHRRPAATTSYAWPR